MKALTRAGFRKPESDANRLFIKDYSFVFCSFCLVKGLKKKQNRTKLLDKSCRVVHPSLRDAFSRHHGQLANHGQQRAPFLPALVKNQK